ncbi:hypothetical protein DFQ28_004459 [Apophysomyces sp. BC1034]|nr:hypothetical protein DFQ30_002726 [Apophysomyces sp. BC1015]KAG0182889.1 hypothetical protein DFQ29_001588 [Apophysomyces sp. BC1021]KAG0193567.1 hypothetical protein DFQ28_004459 [Apophysomyces sp. BC1034]
MYSPNENRSHPIPTSGKSPTKSKSKDDVFQDSSNSGRSPVEEKDREQDLDLLTAENQSLRGDLELEKQRQEKLAKAIAAQSEELRALDAELEELKTNSVSRATCGSLWDDEKQAEATLESITERVTPYQSIFDEAGDDTEKMRQLFRQNALEPLKREIAEKDALLQDLDKEYKSYSEELKQLKQQQQ